MSIAIAKRPMRRSHALVLALLATMSFSACGGGDGDGDQNTSARDTSSTAPSPSPSPSPDSENKGADPADGTPIRITFGDTELTGTLADNAIARDLVGQLPLTLSFR